MGIKEHTGCPPSLKLVEVEAPSRGIRMRAVTLGAESMVAKEIKLLLTSEQDISSEDFVASMRFFTGLFKDVHYIITKLNIFPCTSAEEEVKELQILMDAPTPDTGKCREILSTLLSLWQEGHAIVLTAFRQANDDLTVFITDDGRIATGRYVEESEAEDSAIMSQVSSESGMRPLPFDPAMRVSELGFSVRSVNCLAQANICYLGELVYFTEYNLLQMRQFGRKSLYAVKVILDSVGARLGMRHPSLEEFYKKHPLPNNGLRV